ncbi:uncharacterized protein LOC141594187 [Silene latifolia]|uniref:uncharacterized protein LOC141594187 n=1 Tax=Silene latifolia TaxID=37657 RepID=UPI003D77286F
MNTEETFAQFHQSESETVRIFIPIAELCLQKEGLTIWIKGCLTEVLNQDRCVYTSCNVCKKKTEVELGSHFYCFHATAPHMATSVYRCYLQINFRDESGCVKLTLFDEVAETILQRTTEQISGLSLEEYRSFIGNFLENNKTRMFAIKLVTYKIGEAIRQLRFRAQHVEEVA